MNPLVDWTKKYRNEDIKKIFKDLLDNYLVELLFINFPLPYIITDECTTHRPGRGFITKNFKYLITGYDNRQFLTVGDRVTIF